jgi:hypothetical protein
MGKYKKFPLNLTTKDKIKAVGQEVIDLLIEKNESYGDSALEPANVFADGSAVDNLCARIDDKLMRIKTQGFRGYGEDNVKDLIGYLILLKIAIEEEDQPIYQEWQDEILDREDISHNGYYQTTT